MAAAESTYAGIVRLVEEAGRSKAPMTRLADRFAMVFLLATVALAGGAWLWTGDPIRALAVLVVATPCPLILAVPVAMVAGVSRAAQAGVLVKGGKALEALARTRALVLDKTGTLTRGRARVVEVRPEEGFGGDEVLRFGASLDQASRHVMAQAIVAEARERGLALAPPASVLETPGEGLEGTVEGRPVVIGGRRFVGRRIGHARDGGADGGSGTVTVDGRHRRAAGRHARPRRRPAGGRGGDAPGPAEPRGRTDRARHRRPARRRRGGRSGPAARRDPVRPHA